MVLDSSGLAKTSSLSILMAIQRKSKSLRKNLRTIMILNKYASAETTSSVLAYLDGSNYFSIKARSPDGMGLEITLVTK